MQKAHSKLLLKGWTNASFELMQKNNLKSEDIAYLVPHQANMRIIDCDSRAYGFKQRQSDD